MKTKTFSKFFFIMFLLESWGSWDTNQSHKRHLIQVFTPTLWIPQPHPILARVVHQEICPHQDNPFQVEQITSTELIESLTCLSPPLTIGFSRKTLCLYNRCTIPLPNVLLVRISNPIAFTIQSPSNQLNNRIVHLWTFTFGSTLTLQAYTIGISKQKGIKIGYLNATYVAGQLTQK